MNTEQHSIYICMGSSCFSRGNGLNAEILQRMLDSGELEGCEQIELSGRLCEGLCKDGPIVTIDEELHTRVSPSDLEDLLRSRFGKKV